ncbi:MAG: two-component system, OmpR family, sensor kinase [Solirubrobacteraceae bacterium]|jgi:two-component system OmpR family sensor kinase|nr:two-component system, OmpR family, sensor kinase [Solirubrobacteraceae bacterium]
MASLRARLLAALLILTAAGLLVLGGITYAEQRSFMLQRVDQQVLAAPGAVARALSDQGIGPALGDRDHDNRRLRGGPPPGGPNVGIPPGTYGQRRDSSGKVIGSPIVLTYGREITADPAVPANLPIGRLLTVHGRNGDDTRYRVLAEPDPSGSGTVVVAVPLRELDQTLHRLLVVEGLVIGGVLLVLGLVAWAVVRVGLLPLDRMGHTAGAIAGGDLSHRIESTDPRTEVGRLGIALNAMLDRLERAFAEREASQDRLRRFIADASHELRTPLASIRGYAELFRMGATRTPEDTGKAMRRIEDEAARMGVLVEDLLTLARLDQVPDAPHGEVDLGRLVGDAVDDARATAPDRPIEARVAGRAMVTGDAHQLRQVLANLVRNALVHTPPGTPVEVSVAPSDGDVRLEVRDHGPGLPTEDADELFERFWRSEGGRERGRAGAGLGLAIVAGIVDAHGGRVQAANAPGGGATFVVTLPAAAGNGGAPSA